MLITIIIVFTVRLPLTVTYKILIEIKVFKKENVKLLLDLRYRDENGGSVYLPYS